MSRNDAIVVRLGLRSAPTWLALFLVPVTLVVHQWNPCDSTASVAAGDALVHCGLCLSLGFFAALGAWLNPASDSANGAFGNGMQRGGVRRASRGVSILAIATVVFCGWLAIVTWWVIGRGNVRFAINGFWEVVSQAVACAAIACLASRPGFSRWTFIALVSVGMGIVAYGYWEYGVIQPELRAALARDPAGLFRREGIAMDSSSGLLLADRIRSTEMRSVFALANSLGGFLACLWIVALALGWSIWNRTFNNAIHLRGRGLALLPIALALFSIGLALLLTKSRTAWLASAAGTIFLILVYGFGNATAVAWLRRQRWTVAAVGIVLAVVSGVVYAMDPLIFQEAGKSLAYRLDYWRGAMALIYQRPWLGYGCGNFQSTYLWVKLPTAAESPADPHNVALELAHAGGVALLLVGLVWAGILLRLLLLREPAYLVNRESGYRNGMDRIGREGVVSSPLGSGAESQAGEPLAGYVYAFWGGGIVAALGVLAWNFFMAGDSQLLAAALAVLTASATGVILLHIPAYSASVQRLVQDDGESPSLAWQAAMITTLMIHLMASGGWMLPGTMAMATLVTGLGIHRAASLATRGEDRGLDLRLAHRKPKEKWMAGCLSLGAGVLMVLWWITMASPVTSSQRAIFQSLNNRSTVTVDSIRTVIASDRYDPELSRMALLVCVEQLERPLGQAMRGAWEELAWESRRSFLARDPEHSLAFGACGQAELRMAVTAETVFDREQWLAKADQDFRDASRTYPASVEGHVQAAVAAFLVGDGAAVAIHCDGAEAIDRVTPHRDRKIEASIVFWPVRLVPEGEDFPAEARRGVPLGFLRAEPAVRFLRNSESLRVESLPSVGP